jgi:elongation factor Ts
MTVTANLVKELRERSGAGMMECKKALVETAGDLGAAQELLRTRGQAQADQKAGRIAAEGRVVRAAADATAVLCEVNCETDFVAKDENFVAFCERAADLALHGGPADTAELMAMSLPTGESLEDARKALVAKIGENIAVRRFELVRGSGELGHYLHGARIGVLVDVVGGDADLRKDLAMHIAASRPQFVSSDEVPGSLLESERRILKQQAEQEGKPPTIVDKMVEGRLRKFLNEITLVGQAFVKDPDISVGKLLKQHDATVIRFVRLEVGEGIEKKTEDFAAEVQAQIEAQD